MSCSLTTSLDGLSGGPATDGVLEGAEAGGSGGGSSGGGGDGDAASDASNQSLLMDVAAPVVDGCSATGCFAMPPGFSLVAYGATATGLPCPAGFTAPADTFEGPSLAASACTCGCSVTTQPSCATGTIIGHFDTAGSGLCDSAGGNLANTGCGTDGYLGPFAPGNEHRFTPPAASGGACLAAPVKNEAALTFAAHGRVCQAATVPECAGKVCPLAAGASFVTCIASAGDVACPSGMPTKHLVGSSASFSCGGGCTCGVTATCKGKVNYFATPDCSGAVGMAVSVDDACHPTDAAGASFGSHVYVPFAPTNVACSKTGTTKPSDPALAGATTVCCN